MPLVMSARAKRFMDIKARAAGFGSRIETYEQMAAEAATRGSQTVFQTWLGKRPLAPPRSGRPSTEGLFANFIEWQRGADGYIRLDVGALEGEAPYWAIQEIGTAQEANILDTNGSVAVRSQYGRTIAMSLYWSDSPGGPPGDASRNRAVNQQLYPVSSLPTGNAAATAMARRRTGTIRHEIEGKHYIRDGGKEGFSTLRDEILSDAKKTFF